MRNILVLCLVLMIALAFGCSKKEEATKTETPQTEMAPPAAQTATPDKAIDPVSKEEVDVATSTYSFEYGGMTYYFASAENLEAFKADPAKYAPTLE